MNSCSFAPGPKITGGAEKSDEIMMEVSWLQTITN